MKERKGERHGLMRLCKLSAQGTQTAGERDTVENSTLQSTGFPFLAIVGLLVR